MKSATVPEQGGANRLMLDGAWLRRRAVPVIYQSEAAECGLACLAMVSSFHGRRVTLPDLRRQFTVSLKGTSLKALMDMAHTLNFHGRAIRLDPDELATLKRGTILHWDLRHYVVYDHSSRSGVVVNDPCRGRVRLTWKQFSNSFTGVALELEPVFGFERSKLAPMLRIRDVIGRPRGIAAAVGKLIALALVAQAVGIVMPILNQIVIDDAIARSDLDMLTMIGVALLGLQITTSGLNALRAFVLIHVSNQIAYGLQSNLLRHLLLQPVAWLEKRHIGDISSRFASLKPIEEAVTGTGPAVVIGTISLLFALIFMLLYSPYLTALEVAAFTVLLAVRSLAFPQVRRISQEIIEHEARVDNVFLETIRGARTFKLFNAESRRVAAWQNDRATATNAAVRLSRFQAWGELGTGVLASVQAIVIWYIGGKMVINGTITLGMLIAFKAYADQFNGSSLSVAGGIFTFRGLRVSLDRLSDLVLSPTEAGSRGCSSLEKPIQGAIELRNVFYRYGDHEPWVLNDVSLRIPAGTFACITGPSGSGKSTLLKLLLGFDEPTSGKILYDDVELRHVGAASIRAQIGAVLQDDQLLSGTIADNISFFDPDSNIIAVEHAATRASIHEDIVRFPMGYLTFVGDMGSSLSCGQRQRVLLARALYRDPRILFIDEGTSNLDEANEASIMGRMKQLDITRIVIAHRPTAREGADTLINVLGGEVRVETTSPVYESNG